MSADQSLQKAFTAHREGNLAVAEQTYRQVLSSDPQNPDAMHYLGLLLHQQGSSDEGERLIRQSLTIRGDQPSYFNNLGVVLTGRNDFAGAADAFGRAVQLRPTDFEGLKNLGFALQRLGNAKEAIDFLQRAMRISPFDVPTVSKLAALLREQQSYDEAIRVLQHALRPGPNAILHHELAETYRQKGDDDQAAEHYAQVVVLLPDSAEAHHNLAESLRSASRLHEALDSSRRAVELAPQHIAMRYTLATALKDLDWRDEAVAEFREVLRLSPGHPGATHLIAALTGQPSDGCAPDYVARLFDNYAPKFEEHLTERLYYQAPELLWQAFQTVTEGSVTELNVIDLGCGTGLCGVLFRPAAKHLVGVDLSGAMLELAKAKGCYDELVQAEITDLLQSRPGSVELIVAGDVFNYLGDLRRVLSASHGSLSKGWLAFSVERSDADTYRLEPSGRFTHSPDHVERLAQEVGFAVRSSQRLCMRFDRGQPVHGQFLVLEKQ